MAFCAKFNDAPRLFNYAAASRHEADVVPIRGRPDCKPLGARRKTHATIRRDGEAIICKLYNTDVVTYYPDGRILLKFNGWASQSTCAFISAVAGLHVAIRHNRVWVRARPSGDPEQGTVDLPMHTVGDNWFSGHGGIFDNPALFTVHSINRKGANTVRRIYKPFKDYIKTVMRVRDEGFSMQEMGDAFGWVKGGRPVLPDYIRITVHNATQWPLDPVNQLLALATPTADPDETNANFYKASLWLARSAGTIWSAAGLLPTIRPTEGGMLKLLDDCILLKHREVCFDEVDAPFGKVARDAYARFF